MIGGILAWKDGNVNWVFFMVALLGLIFAHASNNLINDLVDYNKGIDVNNYYRSQYGPQPLENGFLTKPAFYRYMGMTLSLAIAAGIYLVMNTGPLTPVLAFLGLFFLLFYTWPLKYIGMGEKIARYTNLGMWFSQYILVIALVAAGTVSPLLLITLLAIPKLIWAYKVYSKPRPESAPPDLPGGVWPLYLSAHAFNYNKSFGGLFLLGLIADTILFKTGWYFVF